MAILRKDKITISSDIKTRLIDGTTITNFSAGSRAGTMVDAISEEMALLYDAINVAIAQTHIDTAGGVFLDALGKNVGLTRLSATASFTTISDENVKVYVTSGTLSDQIASQTIASGTSFTSGDLTFTTTQAVSFNDVVDHVFVPVLASTSGTGSNIGTNKLTGHSLGGSVLVTNTSPIDNGADAETDQAFRTRIRNAPFTQRAGNINSIRSEALSASSVADVIIQDAPEGPGTVGIFLVPIGNAVNSSTIQQVRSTIASVLPAGIKALVRVPTLIPIQITAEISFVKGTSDRDKVLIARGVEDSILEYLGEIPLGGTLVLNELKERIQSTNDAIYDHTIPCLLVDGKEILRKNIKLEDDELFVPDPQSFDRAIEVLTV